VSKNMVAKQVTIKLVDGSMVKGKINLLAESLPTTGDSFDKHDPGRILFHNRISDLFTIGKNPFIVVVEAATLGREGAVLILNKSKILWVSPED
jgi:hypothetical protein